MKKLHFFLFLVLLFLAACSPGSITPNIEETQVENTVSILGRLGGEPCPESEFTCITLEVPYDHFQPDGRTLGVVFGVLPASGERHGMFVNVTGGPGTSGLMAADGYTAAFDPLIREHFDIVFFDQRGVGLSGGLQCPLAAAAFYRADWAAFTPEEEADLLETAQTFTTECITEMDNPEYLSYLGTDQAVEDLNVFREIMQVDSFWLYGESYGTQYAQTYAAAHPDRLAGLILDGTVDLTLSGFDFYSQQAQAFNDVLEMTLDACNEDALCAADMGGDAAATFDELASLLRASALTFEFPLPSGISVTRLFSLSDLETAAAGSLYSETARMLFLRALAYYERDGNLSPMARILYNSLVLDPETEQAIPDPSYSDAIYYAVECQDYNYPGDTPEIRAEAYLRAGDTVETNLPRFASVFYGDLPCAYWPNATEAESRPAPLILDGVPTLVLGGTADPATPFQNGIDVFQRLADGYHITETGGPHIIFGWGVECVDDLVTSFLLDGEIPEREVTCEGQVISEFFPLVPRSADAFTDPLEAFASVDDELYFLPEYYYWDYETPTSIGCPYGGTFTFESSELGEAYLLSDCAFTDGFVMTGEGSYDYDIGIFTLSVSVSGQAEGTLVYTRDSDYHLEVRGEYNGHTVEISD